MVRTCLYPVTEPQDEFRRADSFIRGMVTGRGAGKTTIGALDIILRARDGDPYMVVSPTYTVMLESTWTVFLETARELGVLISAVKSPIPTIRFRTLDGGTASAVFRSGEDPESLRGGTKAGLWIDEASIQKEEVFLVSLPVLRHRGKLGKVTMTFTPKGRHHWTYGVFYERDQAGEWKLKKDRTLVQAHTLTNPFNPAEYYSSIRGNYTQALAEQELGGEFIELVGLMFLREWFGTVKHPPAKARRVRYWDKAATHGGGAYTCGVLMSRTDEGSFLVEDVVRGQWSYGDRERIIKQTAEMDADRWGFNVQIYIEQEGGSGGKESAEETVKKLCRYPVHIDKVTGKQIQQKDGQKVPGQAKITRAGSLAAQSEARNVNLLEGCRWVGDYLEELCQFPESTFMDQVDASSGAFNQLTKYATIATQPPEMRSRAKQDLTRYGIKIVRDKGQSGRRDRRPVARV